MRTHVDGMDPKLQQLQETISSVAERNSQVGRGRRNLGSWPSPAPADLLPACRSSGPGEAPGQEGPDRGAQPGPVGQVLHLLWKPESAGDSLCTCLFLLLAQSAAVPPLLLPAACSPAVLLVAETAAAPLSLGSSSSACRASSSCRSSCAHASATTPWRLGSGTTSMPAPSSTSTGRRRPSWASRPIATLF